MQAEMEAVWRRKRRQALVVLYVSFVLWGTVVGLAAGPGPTDPRSERSARAQFLLVVPLSLGALWFCSADAKLAGRTLVEMARLGIFFFWPVGVPVYLLWAQGLRGLGVLLLHGSLLCLLWLSSAVATILIVRAE